MYTLARTLAKGLLYALATVAVTALLGELMLRIKNSDQRNYTIEMWRYARELKEISSDPLLGHVHVSGSSAQLQGVDLRINSLGMRGPEPKLDNASGAKVLMLGSSITLGWGIPEHATSRAQLERILAPQTQVLNGGVGNYNTVRSIALFRSHWRQTVRPDIVIVHYFLNDAEILPPSKDSMIMRNSQLAVTLYYVFQGLGRGARDVSALVDHYRQIYGLGALGVQAMRQALDELNDMSKEDGFRVILAMVPDIHQLKNYPFMFAHEFMREIANELNWTFVDFFDDLSKFEGPELWAIPGDPHPNAKVHQLMAEKLARAIKQVGPTERIGS